jgi:hypothetical protein
MRARFGPPGWLFADPQITGLALVGPGRTLAESIHRKEAGSMAYGLGTVVLVVLIVLLLIYLL